MQCVAMNLYTIYIICVYCMTKDYSFHLFSFYILSFYCAQLNCSREKYLHFVDQRIHVILFPVTPYAYKMEKVVCLKHFYSSRHSVAIVVV